MVDRERKKIWDQQWKKRKPKDWDGMTHQRHREVLYGLLGPDEDIEQLVSGHFGPDPEPEQNDIQVAPLDPQTGIAVATQDRVIFVAKGMFAEAMDEIAYGNIKAISYRLGPMTGDQLIPSLITGNFENLLHSIGPSTGRCRIEEHGRRNMLLVNIKPKETVQPFVEHVQFRIRELNPDAPVPESQDMEPPTFVYDPLGDMKEQSERLHTLWQHGHISQEEMLAKLHEMDHRR